MGGCIETTKVALKLVNESDMQLMIESGIRGGITITSHCHAKVKNEYMEAEFDPTKDSKFTSYLHAVNHYGWAMSTKIPTSGFKWMTDDELDDW